MSHCNDYCCNHGCNQGRDCPHRTHVARISKAYPRTHTAKAPAAGQSRTHSAIESVLNIGMGFVISLGITAIVMPAFGHHVSFAQNVAITSIFTVASLARSYALRRLFNRWHA